jgi:hypothetical protein
MLALAVTASAIALQAAPAAAWANNGDGYGTHDWIVDQAVRVLDGRVDSWFDAGIARLASDDPDTVERPLRDQDDHVYHERGKRGGGVDRIATEFDKASASYAAGDYADASYHIGLLAHIYGDLLQPYHTAYAAMKLDSEHRNYEHRVGDLTRKASDMPAWHSSRRTVSTFANIRTKAAASAAYSRALYPALHKAFGPNQNHLNDRAREITGKVMVRAANDLADVIWSISRGSGAQPKIGALRVSVKWVGVRSGFPTQAVFVTAKDVNGKPIEDLLVRVRWPTSTGTREEILFTDPHGFQKRLGPVGTGPLYQRLDVKATAAVRDQVATANAWWALTRALGSGASGFRTKISDQRVVAGQTVTVTSIARDGKGRPMRNLLVTWTWNYDGTKVTTKAITDANGRASSTQQITSSTTRNRVRVTAHTQAASHNRYVYVYFKRVR